MKYRNMDLHVTIRGNGTKMKECTISGKASEIPFLEASNVGRRHVVIVVSPD